MKIKKQSYTTDGKWKRKKSKNTICTKDMKTNTFGMITKLDPKPDLCHSIQLKCDMMLNVRLQNTFDTNLFRSSSVPISLFHHCDFHHLVKRLKLFYVTFNCRWKIKHSNIFRLLGAKWPAQKKHENSLFYWFAPETLYLRSNYPF